LFTKPEKAIYLFNSKKWSFSTRNPWIIGKIEVTVDSYNLESEIDYMGFYIDKELKSTDTTEPFSWIWDEKSFGKRRLKIVAYDNVGNTNSDELLVWRFF